MLVRFKVNLGLRDAAALGLDFAKCTTGSELDVSDKAGESLVSRGIAEQIKALKAVAKPAELKTESTPAPLTGRAKPSDKES